MVPNFQSFFLPLLESLADKQEHNIKDLVPVLADRLNLTKEQRAEMIPSQRQPTLYNRVLWANTYLKKAGLIQSSKRGVVSITKRGEDVLSQKPKELNSTFLKQFPEFVAFQTIKKSNDEEETIIQSYDQEQDPQTVLSSAYETINRALADNLMEVIMSKDSYFFERLVVELLVKMGYSNEDSASFVTKQSGDNGVDGIIRKDKLGFDLVGVQAKQWDKSSSVGRPEIQKFAGALGGLDIANGVFVTTASFSKQAREYKHTGIKIVLIDGDELTRLMINYNVGIQTERTMEFKKIDTDFFEEF